MHQNFFHAHGPHYLMARSVLTHLQSSDFNNILTTYLYDLELDSYKIAAYIFYTQKSYSTWKMKNG